MSNSQKQRKYDGINNRICKRYDFDGCQVPALLILQPCNGIAFFGATQNAVRLGIACLPAMLIVNEYDLILFISHGEGTFVFIENPVCRRKGDKWPTSH